MNTEVTKAASDQFLQISNLLVAIPNFHIADAYLLSGKAPRFRLGAQKQNAETGEEIYITVECSESSFYGIRVLSNQRDAIHYILNGTLEDANAFLKGLAKNTNI